MGNRYAFLAAKVVGVDNSFYLCNYVNIHI